MKPFLILTAFVFTLSSIAAPFSPAVAGRMSQSMNPNSSSYSKHKAKVWGAEARKQKKH